MLKQMNSENLKARCRAVNRNQKGAMAVMSLAAFLILVMVGLTLYDVSELGVEKTHLQTATDTAAYSQATVEARAMNLIAFNNVGKRMTVGMITTYVNMNQWILNISHIATYLSVVCAGAAIFFPAIAGFCAQLAQAAGGASQLYSGESSVRNDVYTKSGKKCWMECFSCSWSGCGWSCCQRYWDIHEWAAPVSDTQWLTGMLPAIPCGRVAPPVGLKFGPISCAQPDIWRNWNAQRLLDNYFGRDLLAMDNYQRYMASLAPYWAWTEGTVRGLVNAAPVTVSYPMPDFGEDQAHVAQVPVARKHWNETCDRAASQDRGLNSPMALDIALKNLISGLTGGGGGMGGGASQAGAIAAIVIAGVAAMEIDTLTSPKLIAEMLPRGWLTTCRDITSQLFDDASGGGGAFAFIPGVNNNYVPSFYDYGRPFLIHSYQGNEAQWLMDSSTLTFGFRPNANRFGDARENKFFLAGDHNYMGPDAGGVWAISRSEISYQGSGGPTAWSPGWTARMRPVALPGEWEAYGSDFAIIDAFNEISPSSVGNLLSSPVGRVTASAHGLNSDGSLITHPHDNLGDLIHEVAAIQAAMHGLSDERLEGLSK